MRTYMCHCSPCSCYSGDFDWNPSGTSSQHSYLPWVLSCSARSLHGKLWEVGRLTHGCCVTCAHCHASPRVGCCSTECNVQKQLVAPRRLILWYDTWSYPWKRAISAFHLRSIKPIMDRSNHYGPLKSFIDRSGASKALIARFHGYDQVSYHNRD